MAHLVSYSLTVALGECFRKKKKKKYFISNSISSMIPDSVKSRTGIRERDFSLHAPRASELMDEMA